MGRTPGNGSPRPESWPTTEADLVRLQEQLAMDAAAARARAGWDWRPGAVVGGCFVAFARGEAGPGHPGDRAWVGAVRWQAGEFVDRRVLAVRVPASYAPGLLALREGPALADAVSTLTPPLDVLLVDATGLDHPRRAGLAVHLGAVLGIPTVGVTHRGLTVRGDPPALEIRGQVSPVIGDDEVLAAWVCTRTGARPLLVHAAWRTGAEAAVEVVLAASTEAARTPAPLQEARRIARNARAGAGAG